jgi:thiol-disulfide isomerase/thioredoxin
MKVLTIVLLFAATAFRPVQPQLSLKDMQGQLHNLSEYKGKVVILNFWATWCVPCKQEMPIFVDVSRKYRDRGVVVVAASLDDDTTRKYIPQFARSFKMDFPILVDARFENMQELGLGESIPSTVFLDPEGNVAGKILGQAKRKDVLHQLDALLVEHVSQR